MVRIILFLIFHLLSFCSGPGPEHFPLSHLIPITPFHLLLRMMSWGKNTACPWVCDPFEWVLNISGLHWRVVLSVLGSLTNGLCVWQLNEFPMDNWRWHSSNPWEVNGVLVSVHVTIVQSCVVTLWLPKYKLMAKGCVAVFCFFSQWDAKCSVTNRRSFEK